MAAEGSGRITSFAALFLADFFSSYGLAERIPHENVSVAVTVAVDAGAVTSGSRFGFASPNERPGERQHGHQAIASSTPWPGKVLEYNALLKRQSNNALPHLTEMQPYLVKELEEYLASHKVATQWCKNTKTPSLDDVIVEESIKTWPDFALKCLNKEYNEDPNLPRGFGFEWFSGGTGMLDPDWELYASSPNNDELVQYKREPGYGYPEAGSNLTWWQDYKEKGFEPISADGMADKSRPDVKVVGFPHKKETLRGKLRRFLHDDADLADRLWRETSGPNSYRLWPVRGPKIFQLLQLQDADVIGLVEYDFHDARADYFMEGTKEEDQITFAEAMQRLGYAHAAKGAPHELALYWKDARFALESGEQGGDSIITDEQEEAARKNFTWSRYYGRILAVKLRQKEKADASNEIIIAVTKLTPKVNSPDGSAQKEQMHHVVSSLLSSRASQRGAIPFVIIGDWNIDAREEPEISTVFGQFGNAEQDSLGLYSTKQRSGELDGFYFGSVFDEHTRRQLCTAPGLIRRDFLDQIMILQTAPQRVKVIENSPQVIVFTNKGQRNSSQQLVLPEDFAAIRDEYALKEATAIIPNRHNPSDHFPISAMLSMTSA